VVSKDNGRRKIIFDNIFLNVCNSTLRSFNFTLCGHFKIYFLSFDISTFMDLVIKVYKKCLSESEFWSICSRKCNSVLSCDTKYFSADHVDLRQYSLWNKWMEKWSITPGDCGFFQLLHTISYWTSVIPVAAANREQYCCTKMCTFTFYMFIYSSSLPLQFRPSKTLQYLIACDISWHFSWT
jgi:hypothetical protein